MHYQALATDYDGTIARHGKVDSDTIAALARVRQSGRKLLLVTGRVLESLFHAFERVDLFDLVVAENGGVLYHPAERRERTLCEAPPASLVTTLRERGAHPLAAGRTIVATREPYETLALEVIHELGIEYHVVFNKGAVMLLPSGVNKATGLEAALGELRIDHDRVAAIGDAENDHALLQLAGFGAAVSNALPALRERADFVCKRDHGAGVQDLISFLLTRDLRAMKRERVPEPIPVRMRGGEDVVPED